MTTFFDIRNWPLQKSAVRFLSAYGIVIAAALAGIIGGINPEPVATTP